MGTTDTQEGGRKTLQDTSFARGDERGLHQDHRHLGHLPNPDRNVWLPE